MPGIRRAHRTLAITALATALLSLSLPAIGQTSSVAGDPNTGQIRIWGPDNRPASEMVSPVEMEIRIPSQPTSCPSDEVMSVRTVNRSFNHADGSTQTSSIQVFSCSAGNPRTFSTTVNAGTGDETRWRSERDIDYDAESEITTITYTTYRDEHVHQTRTRTYHDSTPMDILGDSSRDAQTAYNAGIAVLPPNHPRSPHYTPPDDGDSDYGDGRDNDLDGNGVDDGDSNSCFGAGTPIAMADGPPKPIEKIRLGDIVLAYDGLGVLQPKAVIGRREMFAQAISLAGTVVTPDHLFLQTDGTFVPIMEIPSDGHIIDQSGNPVPVPTRAPLGTTIVYDITVQGLSTYVAAGWRVHNW